MIATSLSVSVRYSRPLADGSHKTVELSCEASLEAEESWKEAQAAMYTDLGKQIKAMFASSGTNGKTAPATKPEHWCPTHETDYQRFSKDNKVWYSHKTPDGWCKESGKK
ncbi:MAG TPA: hypothetical protein VFA32_18470 [Dehalococcoidia bacterium]|nr:hypothetical protein [Dehalococcoidia bacterium]